MKKRASYALYPPAELLAQVYAPTTGRKLGAAEIEESFGGRKLKWTLPCPLGAKHLDLMLAVSAECNMSEPMQGICKDSLEPIPAALWAALNPDGHALAATAPYVEVSWERLGLYLGYKATGSALKRELKAKLQDLARVRLEDTAEVGGDFFASNLLSWVDSGANVTVALNWSILRALSGAQFSMVSLDERSRLGSEVALRLHAYLSSIVRRGGDLSRKLSSLQKVIWEPSKTESTNRARLITLKAALDEIGRLPKWKVIFGAGSVAEISRIR